MPQSQQHRRVLQKGDTDAHLPAASASAASRRLQLARESEGRPRSARDGLDLVVALELAADVNRANGAPPPLPTRKSAP